MWKLAIILLLPIICLGLGYTQMVDRTVEKGYRAADYLTLAERGTPKLAFGAAVVLAVFYLAVLVAAAFA